jgi:hypothetical protein
MTVLRRGDDGSAVIVCTETRPEACIVAYATKFGDNTVAICPMVRVFKNGCTRIIVIDRFGETETSVEGCHYILCVFAAFFGFINGDTILEFGMGVPFAYFDCSVCIA